MKKFYLLVISIIIFCIISEPSFSEKINKDEILKKMSQIQGASNYGREFYFSFIPCWESYGSNNDLRIYVSSPLKTRVTVTVPGRGYEKVLYTKPNDVIQFQMSTAIGQPYKKGNRDMPEPDQVWEGAGVHVVADDPIICYGVTRFSRTSDGFLALPINELGKNYIVASFADFSSGHGYWLPSYTSVTAVYDNTYVSFKMGGNDWSKTASGLLPGETSDWNLNEGDVLLIGSLGGSSEVTGSLISASKPVAVVSGNFCANIPTNCGNCDIIESMELPMKSWGKTYLVSDIYGRKKNSILKIFAKEANTIIYRDNQQIGFVKTVGGVEGRGFLSIRADDGSPRPVIISGSAPISVTQFNTAKNDDGVTNAPFQMILTPLEQFQYESTFNTPNVEGGYGFPNNYVNIVYEATQHGTMPDFLMFAKSEGGEFQWSKLSDESPDPGTPFVKLPDGRQFFSKQLMIDDGVFKLKSNRPFAAYIYGWSTRDSYGFPASMSVKDLEKNDTLPPKPEWSECCGNINVDKKRYVTDKPDNQDRSNLSSIYMHSDLSYNYKLYYGKIVPCETASTDWRLELIDQREDASAVVTFTDCAGNDTIIFINYSATKIKIDTNNYDFGLTSVGETLERKFYVINYSETSEVQLGYVRLLNKDEKANSQGFTIWNEQGTKPIELPQIIQPLDSLPFVVRFEATEEGEFWDSIGIGDTTYFWYFTQVETEVGVGIIQVSDYDFSALPLGAYSIGEFNIINSGNQDLKIFGYTKPAITGIDTNGNEYPIFEIQDLDNLKIDSSNALIIKPNETKTFQVSFRPDEVKNYKDSIVFISNSADSSNGKKMDCICVFTGSAYPNTSVQDELLKKSIKISPNPARNRLDISIDNDEIIMKSIKITDINGYEIYSVQLSQNLNSLDISLFPNGSYFLSIMTNKGLMKHKFMILH